MEHQGALRGLPGTTPSFFLAAAAAQLPPTPPMPPLCLPPQVVRAQAAVSAGRKRPEYIPNRIDDPNYVRIFDTTLRDGEQRCAWVAHPAAGSTVGGLVSS